VLPFGDNKNAPYYLGEVVYHDKRYFEEENERKCLIIRDEIVHGDRDHSCYKTKMKELFGQKSF
jgi:hypothetical protein